MLLSFLHMRAVIAGRARCRSLHAALKPVQHWPSPEPLCDARGLPSRLPDAGPPAQSRPRHPRQESAFRRRLPCYGREGWREIGWRHQFGQIKRHGGALPYGGDAVEDDPGRGHIALLCCRDYSAHHVLRVALQHPLGEDGDGVTRTFLSPLGLPLMPGRQWPSGSRSGFLLPGCSSIWPEDTLRKTKGGAIDYKAHRDLYLRLYLYWAC
jgi:hypothetical protein